MPFGLLLGSKLFTAAVIFYVLLLPAALFWVVVTLVRIRSSQAALLARLTAIEQRLGHRP